jgi:hypothetical protein
MSIDLQRFCADDHDLRAHLRQPFRRGEFVYATNGHVLLRVPVADGYDAAVNDKAPTKLEEMFACIDAEPVAWRDMPPVHEVHKCARCGGTGKLCVEDCESCGGKGEFDRDGYTYDCQACGTEGVIEVGEPAGKQLDCFDCNGRGHESSQRQNINHDQPPPEIGVNVGYLSWLAALPGIVCAPQDHEKAVRFKFDGGHALLMPMRL